MAALPKSFNLFEPIPSLPDGATSTLVTCRPISGSSFGEQSILSVDFSNRGWLDPASISIRYRCSYTAVGANGSAMRGTPVFTPFQRVDTLVGGGSVDTIQQYNMTAHLLTQLSKDVAGKYGLQSMYGYTAATAINPNFDGRVDAAGAVAYTVGAPLIGLMLSNSEKMIPLFALPALRVQITLDSIANMFCVGTQGAAVYGAPTGFSITNFELCYSMVDLGASVEKMVYDHGQPLLIKTYGLNNSAVNVPIGTVGSSNYVFNQRFASIRSAFICPNASAPQSNKWAEIVDITAGTGSYQVNIGNVNFPQTPLSTALNRAGCLVETRRAAGNLYKNDSFAINSVEFNANLLADASTAYNVYEPGKAIFGVSLDKVASADHVMMSGTSTYASPITCSVEMSTATLGGASLNLILEYDSILVLDPVARQLSVRS